MEHHAEEHNKTDRDLGRGMKHAEQQCGKKQHGHAFSPTLKKAGLTVRCWRTKRSGVKNKQNAINRLTKVHDQLNQDDLDTPETTELEAINAKLKEAWKELRKACNIAREECDVFLHE